MTAELPICSSSGILPLCADIGGGSTEMVGNAMDSRFRGEGVKYCSLSSAGICFVSLYSML